MNNKAIHTLNAALVAAAIALFVLPGAGRAQTMPVSSDFAIGLTG